MHLVLDHGYIKFIEHWGSDQSIIEAARMSTDKGFLGWGGDPCPECRDAGRLSDRDSLFKTYECSEDAGEKCSTCKGTGKRPGDEKLLRYLWEHKHATPFEMAGAIFEVKAPIMVFREWHRHRTQSYNEMSARYTPLPNENYIPTPERCLMSGGQNKQASSTSGAEILTFDSAVTWLASLAEVYEHAQRVYEDGLGRGIPKELARLPVPVARYSKMRAAANLRNWLAFMTLRMDNNAQWEIRAYANIICLEFKNIFPRTNKLFLQSMGIKDE